MEVKEGITFGCYGEDYYHMRVIRNEIRVSFSPFRETLFIKMTDEIYKKEYKDDKLVIPKELI